MLLVEGWIVLSVFIIYLMYYILMSFLSDYFMEEQRKGHGRWYNFTWMLILIFVFGTILTMSVHCWGIGVGKDGIMNCRYLTIAITLAVVIITLFHVGWDIYHAVVYDEKN